MNNNLIFLMVSKMETMNVWIENLDNPFVLVGFVVFILAGVISLFIRKAKGSQNQNVKGDGGVNIQSGGNTTYNADKKTEEE